MHTDGLAGAVRGAWACQLVVVEGPDVGRAVDISDTVKTVGGEPSCDLVLTDKHVSGQHISIVAQGQRFAVCDLGSHNGTLYEGSKLAKATVPAGATLKLGETFLRIIPRPERIDVPPSQARQMGELVAESLAMRELFAVLELASASDVTVVLEGETGVGKELAARSIHSASSRRAGPFVAIDCGALPETLVESELLGHTKGAFTGASVARDGAFGRADGGTLYLDELDSVPLEVQSRLLRVLEERTVRPVGGDHERAVDIRVVASSRRDLRQLVTEGAFRADLYYRLSVVGVTIPPLRERREDIVPLVTHLLRRRGIEAGPVQGANFERLFVHDWPGNVRELRNVLDRAVALSPGAASFSALRLTVGAPIQGAGELAIRTDLPFSEAK